jgi:hypothetical protein
MSDDRATISDKCYVDALLAERARTDNSRLIGMAATSAAMFFGVLTAVSVYAGTSTERSNLHNDLIRKGEREAAEIRQSLATKAEVGSLTIQVEKLEKVIDANMNKSMGAGKLATIIGISVGGAVSLSTLIIILTRGVVGG